MMSKKSSTPRRYRFTADYPIIFTDLELGANVTVVRANPALDGNGDPVEAPDGSTLVAEPGDILTPTADPYEHAWLVEIDADGTAVPADDTPPESFAPSAPADGTDPAQNGNE